MNWHLHLPSPEELVDLDSTLKQWEGDNGISSGFASGDLGWSLRNGPEQAAEQLRVVRSGDGQIAAVGTMEGADGVWLTINPLLLMDTEVASAIAEIAVENSWREVATAGAPASIRGALGARGYAVDPDPWTHLWKPLTDADVRDQPDVFSTSTEELIEQRVLVNRSAFEGSTFSIEKWKAMAEGPSFVPELDLVALAPDGRGASALTAWLPGAGACGMIEPMGTHEDFRRQGFGIRVLHASFSELRKLGASGVRVFTPRTNHAAVATYQKAGFRIIELDTSLVLPKA